MRSGFQYGNNGEQYWQKSILKYQFIIISLCGIIQLLLKKAISKLGLTPEMKKMCSMYGDEKFMALGFAFIKSGDGRGVALKSKDVNVSLRALNKTMQYCGECHASYRQ